VKSKRGQLLFKAERKLLEIKCPRCHRVNKISLKNIHDGANRCIYCSQEPPPDPSKGIDDS